MTTHQIRAPSASAWVFARPTAFAQTPARWRSDRGKGAFPINVQRPILAASKEPLMLARLIFVCCMSLVGIVAVTIRTPSPQQQGAAPASQDAALDPLARGIVGTKHDFSDGGRVARDLCLPCHT